MLNSIFAVARLVILDCLRRHAMIGLIIFALAGTAGGLLFFDFIPRDIGRASSDFILSISWLTGFLFLLFHAVPVIAWDDERGALHMFLARPISRKEYAIALFVGLGVLLFALNLILGSLGWGVLVYLKGTVDVSYFQHLSFSRFILAGAGLYWTQLVILAVILFFSSVVRGSFPVLLLTLSYYLISSGLPVVRESFKQLVELDSSGNQYFDFLLKWMTALFPDFSWLDFKYLISSGEPVLSTLHLILPFVLSTLYVIIFLCLTCFIYERRDLQ